MDHDHLFKELISAFFIEFVDLLLPDVSAYLDQEAAIVALDKEIFTDVNVGDKHEADLVMKARFRGEEAFFLIHVESQSLSQADFPRRMFCYFAGLTKKYDLPVYPVVIYSHTAPRRPEPNRYDVEFPGFPVLRFEYRVIQLNRMSWRDFVDKENPVASALMARMSMSEDERPRVKLECLRLLAKLELDPARSKLIAGFIDSYLKLTSLEMRRYEREFMALEPVERDATMALVSSWEQKGIVQGIEQGIEKGKQDLIVRMIRQRFGEAPETVVVKLGRIPASELDDLGAALFSFTSIDDVTDWLAARV